ncbi:MAG: Gfo/Idh/MocA family oxidoreductase [Sedimentisphaerales bacterium]|nr:Gfo/Idh/MocA family oxidoreductase [Sedimentisphaerales bacterium]
MLPHEDHLLTRRELLRSGSMMAVAGLGLPYIVRASAIGRTGRPAASNRIVMAAIGTGSQGTSNLRAFLGFREVQVVAVCDVDRAHSGAAKRLVDQQYGNSDCRTYVDYRELLAKESLDAVSIALPDHWHAIVAVACARAGLDIYGEKPLARTIAEGRAICDAVKRYDRIWQTGSWQRSEAHFRRACELVINGRIGKVKYVEAGLPDGSDGPDVHLLPVPEGLDWDMWLGPAPYRPYQDFTSNGGRTVHYQWRWIMDYSGGQITDWAGHHVDIAHWGLGLEYTGPVEIEGQGVYPTRGIYDVPKAYRCRCRYANGIEIVVANASQLPHGMGTTWYGDLGWIHVDRGNRLIASDQRILLERIGPHEIHLYQSDDHFGNFLECVRTRRQTVTPAEVAHRSISVALLGEIAMLVGRRIKWDPHKEQIIGDPEAARLLSRPMRSPWHI